MWNVLWVISYVCVNRQFDIDDILRVAEQRSVEELKNSATDQLLSQFKVALYFSARMFLILLLVLVVCVRRNIYIVPYVTGKSKMCARIIRYMNQITSNVFNMGTCVKQRSHMWTCSSRSFMRPVLDSYNPLQKTVWNKNGFCPVSWIDVGNRQVM